MANFPMTGGFCMAMERSREKIPLHFRERCEKLIIKRIPGRGGWEQIHFRNRVTSSEWNEVFTKKVLPNQAFLEGVKGLQIRRNRREIVCKYLK
jgi:hypothetical protein